jgi:UTP--glucose-1-phosphate uridylyltransferase
VLEDHFDLNPELNSNLEQRGKTAELAALKQTEIASGHLYFTRQHMPLGLGHAVWCAQQVIGREPFAILLPDDVVLSDRPCLSQMMDVYDELGGNVVAVVDVPREHTNRYGILDVASDDGRIAAIKGLVEKPHPSAAPSTLSIIGRYILQPEIFDHFNIAGVGAGGEIQLTDAMAQLIGTQPFHGYRFEGKRYDCGDKVGFLEANIAFALRRPDLADKLRAALEPLLRAS